LIDLFIMVTTLIFGALAVNDSMVRVYYQFEARDAKGTLVVSTAGWIMIFLSTAMLAAGKAIALPVSKALFHGQQHASLISIAFAAVFFGNLVELGLVYQRLRQRPALFIALSIGQVLLNAAMNIWFIVIQGMGVRGFVLARLFTMVLAATMTVTLMIRETGLG